MISFDRNQWSRCTGLRDHLPPESVITFDRNTHRTRSVSSSARPPVWPSAGSTAFWRFIRCDCSC